MMTFFNRNRRSIAIFFIAVTVFQIGYSPVVYALTSGPTQPEAQGFQPAGTSDMVDLFSGDFSYNIPLFELPGPNGGYPFNLSYQGGVSMDTEASWVGLGFSLNPGTINRQMRGLPDEFKGDDVYTKMAVEPNVTVGLGAGVSGEVFGAAANIGSLGLGVTYNNFKGFGYSIDGNVGFKTSVGSGYTTGVGLNFKLDSQEGVSATPSLSLSGRIGDLGLSAGYNSKRGLSSMSLTHGLQSYGVNHDDKLHRMVRVDNHGTSSATLSLAAPGYTPQVSMPMRNINISARFQPGGAWWGIFAKGYISGFYSEQWLHNNKKRVKSDAYGYMNYQYADATSMTDFNREKEGIVSKVTPNLPIPSQTYDIYSVTGQGISAMYRPMRNDHGILYDPEMSSISVGGSIGVDVAVALSKVGVNLNVNHTKSTSGKWTDDNSIAAPSAFQAKKPNDLYEPVYFKAHGENIPEKLSSLGAAGGTDAVRVKLDGDGYSASASNRLEGKSGSTSMPDASTADRERKVRSQVIQTITNEELLSGRNELIPHFQVSYLNENDSLKKLDRQRLQPHHVAGFTALTAEGLRYNYGIPAYNLKQEEVMFSAKKESSDTTRVQVKDGGQGDPKYNYDDTEKFLKRVELPGYAHSFLLTSIIGPDYVDITGDGVSEDDLGYWVKFTYKRTASAADPFRWRDPFSKAHYQEGWKTDPRDDKGSFTYGEKEIWYLAKAETKSHIATFAMEERTDGMGVLQKLQDQNLKGKKLSRLKEIKLYARTAGANQPIKAVKFKYDYSLCRGVYNSAEGGKLTLKEVWFEYGNSSRGSLNPYVFKYHANNPRYDQLSYDRWGAYKPHPANDPLYNIDFPYSEQDPLEKEAIDANAAAWSLQEIQLPSGGKIVVDYESDDYGYVQHQAAMQMMEIVNTEGAVVADGEKFQLADDAKVRFKLERSIPGSRNLTAPQQRAEVMKYLDQKRKQLYFKIKVNLQDLGKNFYEYISGYADIDFSSGATMELSKNTNGDYAYGTFTLQKDKNFHPFSLRAWQHIRTNQPELSYPGSKLTQTSNVGDQVGQIMGLSSVFTHVRQMFEGFYNYCRDKHWGREVIAGKSWVRLNSPDKIKYGGGLRVKQVTMMDNWANNDEGVYGQVYDYTIVEGNETISSGVAAYEPMIGGEENALHYAKKFVESVPLRSANNMYFEYPINESYYPGPQVGYRKVSVMSLAAASLSGRKIMHVDLANNKSLFPKPGQGVSYGTSGLTEHEFYTAKDFPVITEETEKDDKPYQLSVPVPFLGNISLSKLTTSQGYSIITNDMHGKQKKVSTFRQDRQGKIEPVAISWVQYNYASQTKTYEQENVFALNAQFKDNGDGTLSLATKEERNNAAISKYSIGQENDFFLDMRQHVDDTWEGGASINTEILYIPIIVGIIVVPAFVPWPAVGKNSQTLRTAVTNKVIFKTGILESTEAYDGGSKVITQNVKWDKNTGMVSLTQVNNNFDAPIYSYSIPAYTQYQGMGAAFQNIGLTFSISNVEKLESTGSVYSFLPSVPAGRLCPGDEILLYPKGDVFAKPVGRVVFTGEEEGQTILHSGDALTSTSYNAMIVRSGFRNQLSVQAGSITGLEDPSLPGASKVYSKVISVPNE